MPRHWNDLNRAGNYSQGLLGQNSLSRFGGLMRPGQPVAVINDDVARFADTAGMAPAAAAMSSYANRNAPPSRKPISPITIRREGRKVSDIFKDAQLGQYGPAQLGEYGPEQFRQFGPGAPAAPGGGLTAPSPMEAPAPEGIGDPGPQGFVSKIGDFLNKPGVGQSMMAAGARMMQGSPDGTFATIGQGLEAGLGTYQELKGQRLLRADAEEERRIQDEDRARRIAAEDLEISQNAARREAYGRIMPIDPVTGERGEFDLGAWDDAFATAVEQGDTQFAGVLMQMRPKDPEEIPLDDFKQMSRSQKQPDGSWRDVFYRTGADGNVEFQVSEYTVAPPTSSGAGGSGSTGAQLKDELTGNAAIKAINSLVDNGGWLSLTGQVRDDARFRELRGELLLENPEATANQIMEYTRDSWSDAEGYMPDMGWWSSDEGEDQDRNSVNGLVLGDEASMLLAAVLQDTSGQGGEGDWLITKGIKNKLSEIAKRNPAAARFAVAQAQALQAINPMVRFLSGAQMTNAEAMRYYGALIPTWGDPPEVANAKMRGLMVMARAMRGDAEATALVDMTGFQDNDALTPQENLERRNEWARTQIGQVMQGELSRIERGEDVAAARDRQASDLALFNRTNSSNNGLLDTFDTFDPYTLRTNTQPSPIRTGG